MKEGLPRLLYVSQGKTPEEHLQSIKAVCAGGCRWVQLRLKGITEALYTDIASRALEICSEYDAKLTINDNIRAAQAVGAFGVHVGQGDERPVAVRAQWPDVSCLGGTANTVEEMLELVEDDIDYIGLGPFRYTTTKKKLSPVLGLEGYRARCAVFQAKNIQTPVYAIGGITVEDIPALMQTGIYGIAVSGLLAKATHKKQLIDHIHKQIETCNHLL